MLRTLPIWLALILVAGAGVLGGLWSGRWAVSAEIQSAVARLEGFPLVVGDWQGQSQELNARMLEIGEISSHAACRYVNRRDGKVLSVLVVCGLPGPIAVHTPDVCYRGAGYEPAGPLVKRSVELGASPSAEFQVGNFAKQEPGGTAEHLRVFWSWSASGAWQVPKNPRFHFARYPVLYKLYVIRPTQKVDEPLDGDPALEFLRLLLPRLQQALFPIA